MLDLRGFQLTWKSSGEITHVTCSLTVYAISECIRLNAYIKYWLNGLRLLPWLSPFNYQLAA
jgi:hypothetical protein